MSDQKKLSAREYLKQLEVLDMQINDDIATLSDMKMNVCSAGGIDYSRDKVQTSPVGDKLCKDVVRYISLQLGSLSRTLYQQHLMQFQPPSAIFGMHLIRLLSSQTFRLICWKVSLLIFCLKSENRKTLNWYLTIQDFAQDIK